MRKSSGRRSKCWRCRAAQGSIRKPPPERHRGQESRHIAQAVPGACCHAGGSSNPEAFKKGPQALEGIAAGRTDAASATRKALSGMSRRRCGASSTLLCEVHLAAPSKSACDLSRQLVSTLLFFQKIEDSVDYKNVLSSCTPPSSCSCSATPSVHTSVTPLTPLFSPIFSTPVASRSAKDPL